MSFSARFLDRLRILTAPEWISGPTMMSIRNGFLLSLPLVVTGALAIIFNNLPITAYQAGMSRLFGDNWSQFGALVWQGTFGILSLPILVGISHYLTEYHNQRHPTQPISPVIASLVALACLLVITPLGKDVPLSSWLGVQGLFISILVAVLATRLFLYLAQSRYLHMTLYSEGLDAAIPLSFWCLAPGVLTILGFTIGHLVLHFFTGISVHEVVHKLMLYPFSLVDDVFNAAIAYVTLTHLSWFMGIHGSNVFDPLAQELFEHADKANLEALLAGLPPPHPMSKHFMDIFVFMGGAGSSLCLLIAIFIASKNRNSLRLAKISVAPGLLNINEILLYGLPIILNPIFFLPFIFTPLIIMAVSSLALRWGFIPWPAVQLDWTATPLLSGYLATGSWRGTALQVLNLIIGTLIYLPFVKVSDRVKEERQRAAMEQLMEIACNNAVGPSGKKCLDRNDEIGILARMLANDLEEASRTGVGLYLEYQPQVDHLTNTVFGSEALVRWRHPLYGNIPAPIVVAICEDGGVVNKLGLWVLDQACAERARWHAAGVDKHHKLSVNVSIQQLFDALLPDKIAQCVTHHQLERTMIGIEVTESIALDPESPHNYVLKRVHDMGFIISMDDFGMGHSSLSYLKYFPVNILKIDKALSKDVASSKISTEIITTIVELCEALKVTIVVEFVENQEQIDTLRHLGCHIFQGYFFSKPLSGEKMLAYALQNRAAPAAPPAP
ncbi:PTS lactose transporter subunit IIC [Betaproteobacteria bacterium]|nr:PTS lactose transporter subunit IIC [Betaproteobacteria bacterium]GHT97437.1 PTS lactose transporter subunit IIC [Betaproteobacteria bacterium]GHU00478.1 PTS lactose transporter subunit IIC [Betaproteobacteria bacterium]GHU06951.1 PTS lactose transporter subunit IIC [Betaproteobacteria bacterium]GHU18286.1 PTS lactose transporter subunit IIC [Betaproteobacteria bacterium]